MGIHTRFTRVGVATMAFALTVSGCAVESGPTENCENAVIKALDEEKRLYDTHPLWDFETTVDSTPEEFAEWDRLVADEQAQWTAIYSQIYASCESPADWWAAAQMYPGIAGVTSADVLKPEDISLWCRDSLELPACVGIEDWLATQ
ncbi:hypothetical protein AB0O95_10435 [Rhodoglobus sp. NPDC076762]